MKPQTQRAINIFTGAVAHQYSCLQARMFAAQQYLTTAQRMADIMELVQVLDAATSDDDADAIAAIERHLSYYRHREWSLRVMELSYSLSDCRSHPETLPYVEADGGVSTVRAAHWARNHEFEGQDKWGNPTHVTLQATPIAHGSVLMGWQGESNSSMDYHAVLDRPANVIRLSRSDADLYYGNRYVVCDPAIMTQEQLFETLASRQ